MQAEGVVSNNAGFLRPAAASRITVNHTVHTFLTGIVAVESANAAARVKEQIMSSQQFAAGAPFNGRLLTLADYYSLNWFATGLSGQDKLLIQRFAAAFSAKDSLAFNPAGDNQGDVTAVRVIAIGG